MNNIREYLKLSRTGLKGKFLNFTGKSGDHWISIIPSLNVSGYGDTEQDSIKDLEYNLKILCEDLFSLNETQRDLELKKMGWERNKIFKKQYSSAYVDENGVLQNFDSPSQVKKSILEPSSL
ncbi:hypothetical protein FHS04_002789 [Mesoflavibacter sabulilitoris]|uniref:Uncharacterized protein n=1 Tax=Mesoflavibacter zeaxanthinifaciens subsp. sabulilitoris TaxID=1520893 RepID=A0A2T1NNK7_9FLAO|nr:hypothetical protein [Mesoflavibacter zeaxanthinifaciens]MBB3125245.1 hypothetical protein [Mesoflavibacter zeaxanthinifaciens subsp. sabulilitoris]PSG94480.1 hypothetical protein C7H61_00675 [Mesoflavibacter zeaxanthinifaciens subsp. sabulilitoris]